MSHFLQRSFNNILLLLLTKDRIEIMASAKDTLHLHIVRRVLNNLIVSKGSFKSRHRGHLNTVSNTAQTVLGGNRSVWGQARRETGCPDPCIPVLSMLDIMFKVVRAQRKFCGALCHSSLLRDVTIESR